MKFMQSTGHPMVYESLQVGKIKFCDYGKIEYNIIQLNKFIKKLNVFLSFIF